MICFHLFECMIYYKKSIEIILRLSYVRLIIRIIHKNDSNDNNHNNSSSNNHSNNNSNAATATFAARATTVITSITIDINSHRNNDRYYNTSCTIIPSNSGRSSAVTTRK